MSGASAPLFREPWQLPRGEAARARGEKAARARGEKAARARGEKAARARGEKAALPYYQGRALRRAGNKKGEWTPRRPLPSQTL